MPYDPQSGQALAAFLSIKRKKGLAAAKAFGRKHRADMSAAMKHNQNARKHKRGAGYVPRADQSSPSELPFRKRKGRTSGGNRFTNRQKPPAFMHGTQD